MEKSLSQQARLNSTQDITLCLLQSFNSHRCRMFPFLCQSFRFNDCCQDVKRVSTIKMLLKQTVPAFKDITKAVVLCRWGARLWGGYTLL